MSDYKKCELCGKNMEGEDASFEYMHAKCWEETQTFYQMGKGYHSIDMEKRQAFVRRVRHETCKWYDTEAQECGDSSHDCFGCDGYEKDAPRPSPEGNRDCKLCIHFTLPDHCGGYKEEDRQYVDITTLAPCKIYVPRSCGNCYYCNNLSPRCETDNCIKHSNWQPRPVKTEQICMNCQAWTACKTGDLAYGKCSAPDGYKYNIKGDCSPCVSSCFKPRPPVIKSCNNCKYSHEFHHASEPCQRHCHNDYLPWELFVEASPAAPAKTCPTCKFNLPNYSIYCGGCNKTTHDRWGEKESQPPACARCGMNKPIAQNMQLYKKGNPDRLVPVCSDCKTELVKERDEISWDGKYQKETAAGRTWACDKTCDNCGQDNLARAFCDECTNHSGWIPKMPAAAPVFDKQNPPYSPEELDWIKTQIVTGEWQVLTTKKDVKIMFKCAQCGYEDETRKKVKYCPACGSEVEKKVNAEVEHKCSTCKYENVSCYAVIGSCQGALNIGEKWQPKDTPMEPLMVHMVATDYAKVRQELESLKREKGDLAAQVEYHKKRASEFDHTAYLAQIESAKLQQEVTQLSKDRYAEAQRADKLQEKLARKGIPRTCRKMIKQLYAHGNFKGSNCDGVFDKIGCDSNNLKCNECGMQYTLEEIRQLSKVEKPAPLWKLRRQAEKEYKRQCNEFRKMIHAFPPNSKDEVGLKYRIYNEKQDFSASFNWIQLDDKDHSQEWRLSVRGITIGASVAGTGCIKYIHYEKLLEIRDQFWDCIRKWYEKTLTPKETA